MTGYARQRAEAVRERVATLRTLAEVDAARRRAERELATAKAHPVRWAVQQVTQRWRAGR